MAVKKKNTKDHRDRKNKTSREDYRAKQHESNMARGKQCFNLETKEWTR